MSWVDPFGVSGIRANADIPRDAAQALLFGARASASAPPQRAMFFAEDRIGHVATMILSETEEARAKRSRAPAHAAR